MIAQEVTVSSDSGVSVLFIIGLVVALVVFLTTLLIAFVLFRDWARAFFSGAGISLFDVIGMKLRRSDSKLLIDCRIASVQAGTPVPMPKLESAYLSAADVRTVTLAYIDAQKSGQKTSFEELVDASRSNRLAEILNMKRSI